MIKFIKHHLGLGLTDNDKQLIQDLSCDCELNAGMCKIKREVRGRGALFTDVKSLNDCPRHVRGMKEAREKAKEIVEMST